MFVVDICLVILLIGIIIALKKIMDSIVVLRHLIKENRNAINDCCELYENGICLPQIDDH